MRIENTASVERAVLLSSHRAAGMRPSIRSSGPSTYVPTSKRLTSTWGALAKRQGRLNLRVRHTSEESKSIRTRRGRNPPCFASSSTVDTPGLQSWPGRSRSAGSWKLCCARREDGWLWHRLCRSGSGTGWARRAEALQARYLWSDDDRARFEREALTWVILDHHPNIATADYLEHVEDSFVSGWSTSLGRSWSAVARRSSFDRSNTGARASILRRHGIRP